MGRSATPGYLRQVRSLVANVSRIALAGLAALGLVVSSPGLAENPDDRYGDWIQGPVRYLVTRTETRLFKRLKSPEERLDFIRRFWERRDPNPVTPVNEARLTFWQRVAEANRLFSDSAIDGWKGDRGKIYILLGPPDDIERDLEYDTQIGSTAGRGLMRWIYTGLERASTRAFQAVPFVRDAGNDWHLTDDPRYASPSFNIYSSRAVTQGTPLDLPSAALTTLADQVNWFGPSRLGTAMDLGRLQEVPTERDLVKAAVSSEEFLGTMGGRVRAHTLHGPGGKTLLAITAAVRRDDLVPAWSGSAIELSQRLLASVALERVGATEAPEAPLVIDLADDAFVAEPAPATEDPWLRLQAIREVPAGTWRVRGVVVDRVGGGAAVFEERLSFDALDPAAPRINGPIVATTLLPAADRLPTGTEPFRMGEAVVVPVMDDSIDANQPFAVFLEVAAARGRDEPVALSWQIHHTPVGAEAAVALGARGSLADARGTRAWQFPAGKFARGRYDIVFRAESVSGGVAESHARFTIAGESPAGDAISAPGP